MRNGRTGATVGGHSVASGDPARYRVEAVTRAVEMLTSIGDGAGNDPAALAERISAPEAFARAALATLERRGLTRAPGEGQEGWALGFAWLRLAEAARRQIDLREIAEPIMRRMREEVDETVFLATRRGTRRINIAFVEGTQAIRRISDIDNEAPLYAGAAGRALLTGLEPAELRAYLRSVAASDGAVIMAMDVETYARDVEAVATRGYAVTEREVTRDLCAVSAPVLDQAGGVTAALTISVPVDRFNEALTRACVHTVVEGARDLSRLIGHMG